MVPDSPNDKRLHLFKTYKVELELSCDNTKPMIHSSPYPALLHDLDLEPELSFVYNPYIPMRPMRPKKIVDHKLREEFLKLVNIIYRGQKDYVGYLKAPSDLDVVNIYSKDTMDRVIEVKSLEVSS